jgi:hypothetical protein
MSIYERPFGRYFEDFEIGDVYKHWPGKTITEFDDHLFCMLTMNHHPLHSDAWFAETQSVQKKNVVVDKVVAQDGKTYDVKRKEYYAKAYSPKNPNLEEAHIALFNQQINGRTHSALVDVAGCLRLYMATAPQYRVDICAPANRTPSNVELCRIINPGPPLAHKVPRLMPPPPAKGKKGGRRTRKNKHKKTQRKNRRSRRQ